MQKFGKKLSKDQLQQMRGNLKQEYKNINTVYSKHIKTIDAQIPEKYRTTEKDRKYKNHYNAKNDIIKEAAMAPHTNDKLASLLLKKLGYESANEHARNLSWNKFNDVVLYGGKPHKPTSVKQYSKKFKNYMNPKQFGPYRDYLEGRSDRIWYTKYNLFKYLSARAKPFIRTKYTQPFDEENRNKKLRRWGNDLKNSKDTQAVVHKVLNQRKKYSPVESPKSFKQTNITPSNKKGFQQVYKEVTNMEAALKNPSKYYANHINNSIIPNYSNKFIAPGNKAKQLLGIDDGASLNKKTRGGSRLVDGYSKQHKIQPYVDNNFYDTATHKHLNRKDVLSRAQHLDTQMQALKFKHSMSSSTSYKMFKNTMKNMNSSHNYDKHRNKILQDRHVKSTQKPKRPSTKRTRRHNPHHDGPSLN